MFFGVFDLYGLSHVMRKPDFGVWKNEGANRYIDSTILLFPKSEISSL